MNRASLNSHPLGHAREDIDLLWAVVIDGRDLQEIQHPKQYNVAGVREAGVPDFCSGTSEECPAIVVRKCVTFSCCG